MDCTGKDGAEDYPQIGGRTEEDAHDGAEDGASACNVEKLDKIDLPRREGHEVHTVGFRETGCRAVVVGAEHLFYQGAVEKIAQKKGNERDDKSDHKGNRFSQRKRQTKADGSPPRATTTKMPLHKSCLQIYGLLFKACSANAVFSEFFCRFSYVLLLPACEFHHGNLWSFPKSFGL